MASQAALGISRFYMRLMTGINNLCMFLQKRHNDMYLLISLIEDKTRGS
jgi:hypothetical protein